jgi:hypothetical protein
MTFDDTECNDYTRDYKLYKHSHQEYGDRLTLK